MPSPQLTVIVVSYNTKEITLECLRSLSTEIDAQATQVIVVDNDSPDGSAQAIAREFPWVELIALKDNIGFARANNLAAESASGRYLLLLNPDTVVLSGAIGELLRFARRRPDAGIWGGRTLFADGSLNPLSCQARPSLWNTLCGTTGLSSAFRSSRIFDRQNYGPWKRDSERDVDIVSGCFLLTTTSLWRELGGFHPDFCMYGEETDFCLRARQLGCRPAVTHRATIVHLGGASERVRADKAVKLFDARARLIRRHWSAAMQPIGLMLLWLWPLQRALAHSALALTGSGSAKAAASSWWQVWKRRDEWLDERPFAPKLQANQTSHRKALAAQSRRAA